MAEDSGRDRSPLRLILTILFVAILPLAVGLYLAPRLVPKPKVGLIRLNYEIFSDTALEMAQQLEYARNDPAIEAVVLIINSPGGSAAFSEELYLDVLNTRQQMPVVATIDLLAASGAFYIASAADQIYAKPTSSVGSIGVITSLPGAVFIEEDVLTTGPYKAFGGTRDSFTRQAERAKYAFLQAVVTGREGRLEVDPAELSRAEIYSGVQAMEFGLVDGLISTDEAIKEAAALAGLSDYEVAELLPLALDSETDTTASFARYQPPAVDIERLWAPPSDLPPGLYYLYIELPSNR
jgi:protease-4